MFDYDLFLKILAALLALMNPLFAVPVFLSMTEDFTPDERKRTARLVTLTVTLSALAAILVGEELLSVFAISVNAFRVAGGVIIFVIALSMLNADSSSVATENAPEQPRRSARDIAIVPIGIPIIVGPGVIATAIVFAHELDNAGELVSLVPAVLIVCLLLGIALRFATPIAATVGPTALNVVSRLMAIILAAIAVEMILTGLGDAMDEHYPAAMSTLQSGS